MTRLALSGCALLLAAGLTWPALADDAAVVTIGPPSSDNVAAYARPLATPALSHAAKLALLRQRVKYVFVLFQENRSFDQHFGTFPGADGLFSKPAASTPGFVQPIVNTDGSVGSISPFLITATVPDRNGAAVPLYPADTDTVDHSHVGIDNGLDLDAAGVSRNDRYALNEERLTTTADGKIVALATGLPPTAPPTLAQKQRAELVMAHLDCDTVPFLWRLADRFTLFDNFRQTVIGPSTPNAIAMIAGQSGDTQWALHPEQSRAVPLDVRSGAVRRVRSGQVAHQAAVRTERRERGKAHAQSNLRLAAAVVHGTGHRVHDGRRSEPGRRSAGRAAGHQGHRRQERQRDSVGLVSGRLRP